MIKKPMLSGTLENLSDARFPLLATPKLDGIRCLRIEGKTLSRKFKPIPNKYVQSVMNVLPDGLDGELMIKGASFNEIQSGIMSEDGEPDFEFWVFDYVTDLSTPYYKRMEQLGSLALPTFCKKVLPIAVNNIDDLVKIETSWLNQGFEGVMLRSMTSPYKNGRSTLKEHFLLKLKQFKDSEAKIIGFVEQMHNNNEAEIDELGHTKRSKKQDNMIPANTLGKFIVVEIGDTPWSGKEFFIGTGEGLTAELRETIWNDKEKYLNKVVTYKYQPHGTKDLPRLPIWKGFRSDDDIS